MVFMVFKVFKDFRVFKDFKVLITFGKRGCADFFEWGLSVYEKWAV